MAVNLTKPFKGVEYTPEHLIAEEDSISSLTAFAEPPVEVKQAKTDLNICMDELLQSIETADEDTQQRFIKDFFKNAKKKRRVIKKEQSRHLYLSDFIEINVSALVTMVCSMVAILLSLYLPSLGEWFAGSLIELDADAAQSIMELCGYFRWIFRIVGFFGLVCSSTIIIKKLLRTMLFFG